MTLPSQNPEPRRRRAKAAAILTAPIAESDSGIAEQPKALPGDPGHSCPVSETTVATLAHEAKAPRPGSHLATLVGLMRRPEGATVAAMVAATGWQSHSVRGALAGALKKKYGLTITSEPADGGRVYRMPIGEADA